MKGRSSLPETAPQAAHRVQEVKSENGAWAVCTRPVSAGWVSAFSLCSVSMGRRKGKLCPRGTVSREASSRAHLQILAECYLGIQRLSDNPSQRCLLFVCLRTIFLPETKMSTSFHVSHFTCFLLHFSAPKHCPLSSTLVPSTPSTCLSPRPLPTPRCATHSPHAPVFLLSPRQPFTPFPGKSPSLLTTRPSFSSRDLLPHVVPFAFLKHLSSVAEILFEIGNGS